MRWTESLIPTLRKVSQDVEATSHQLMLKAGLIRKLASGLYSYLPLGFRVLQKVIDIIRDEMDRAGAIELLLPALHPAEIWKQTGRYEALGQDKISFRNRSGQEFVLGPTHEEVITELAGAYLKTHHVLPKTLYQIQTKFRDELRPRFGIIRTKEFMMKDAYSFDVDEAGLDRSYQRMYQAYERLFRRMGLAIDVVSADPGIMGGNVSHEFMVRSEFGEDRIVACKGESCGYLASLDIASRAESKGAVRASPKPLETFDTPNLKTVEEISSHFNLKSSELMKTLLYFADDKPVAACVRGDHEVNEGKLRRLLGAKQLRLAEPREIEQMTGAPLGFTGGVGLRDVTVIVDYDVANGSNFVTGANQKDKHLRNVNVGRDFKANQIADLRYVEEGDTCLKCTGKLVLVTAMEVGHVFKLGTRYSEPLGALYRGPDGTEHPMVMGCYGLGVNRIVAALVEQGHDSNGICWPTPVAPYQVHLVTVNQEERETREAAEELYQELVDSGFECLYDDRNERAGVKFNDADLIGCPIQLIVSSRNLVKGEMEIKIRRSLESLNVPRNGIRAKLTELLKAIGDGSIFP